MPSITPDMMIVDEDSGEEGITVEVKRQWNEAGVEQMLRYLRVIDASRGILFTPERTVLFMSALGTTADYEVREVATRELLDQVSDAMNEAQFEALVADALERWIGAAKEGNPSDVPSALPVGFFAPLSRGLLLIESPR